MGRKKDIGRIIGVFVVMEARSHGSVKGKDFVDDGNTEVYCQPWWRAVQMKVWRVKGLAEWDNEEARVGKTDVHCTVRMRKNQRGRQKKR